MWAELDYTAVEDPDVAADVTWQAARSGTGHGIAVWFDSTLFEDITITTAPDQPKLVYGNAFLPWAEPVVVEVGDSIEVGLRADLVGDEYVWQWNSRITGEEGVKAEYKQSTFLGKPMSMAALRARAASHVPTLNREGEIERYVLSSMDGQTPLIEIARRCQ